MSQAYSALKEEINKLKSMMHSDLEQESYLDVYSVSTNLFAKSTDKKGKVNNLSKANQKKKKQFVHKVN